MWCLKMTNKKIIIGVIILYLMFITFLNSKSFINFFNDKVEILSNSRDFRLISSTSNAVFDQDLIEYAKSQDISLKIDHYGDLEIVDVLNDSSNNYDGVWISNSMWLYMLNNSSLVTDSKSIAIDPVVMGVTESKAKELGFVGKDIYNKDILDAVSSKKLNYVMTSVTKTNTGATAYLSFINSLAGSPEVLKSEMLDDPALIKSMKEFFMGVQRVSGDESYLTQMFLNGTYDAVIDYESSLIELNEKLLKTGKETLYLLYPVDGVALNDMPFGYVNRSQKEKKKEQFKVLQDYLRSDDVRTKLENMGFRSWYGGIKENASSKFNKNYGIDTSKYLISLKYPSKSVMDKAFDLYINELRKPTNIVFCLDISGSMAGSGLTELKEAMNYILDKEQTKKDRLQFSDKDKVTIITFNNAIKEKSLTYNGSKVYELKSFISKLYATGGTNIYSPSTEALSLLKSYSSDEYTKTVILMTDGQSNSGSFADLSGFYKSNNLDIPIYGITFGDASLSQLQDIANLSNGKVFDGKAGLKQAFKEVRSYN